MKAAESWLKDIHSTNASCAHSGYEIVRALCTENPFLANQILEELIGEDEPYFQLVGLFGISLLASPDWEPQVIELIQHAPTQVKNAAARTLGFIGMESSIAHLLDLSSQGYDGALWALRKLLPKFPKYASRIFNLSKGLLLFENPQIREQATATIIKLAKVKEAEAALLQSAAIFADEFTLDALKGASAAVLSGLIRLKACFRPEHVEYQYIERTINTIEEKQK